MELARKQADLEKAALAATLESRTAEFKIAMDAQTAAVKNLTERTTTQAKQLETLQARTKEQADLKEELLKQYNSLLADMTRLREAAETASIAQNNAEGQLAAIQMEQSALTALVQQVLLASATQGETLIERQAAARKSQLIRRGALLRSQVADPETRRLLDTQEILLTQLDLLNSADPAEVQTFMRLLRQADIPRRVSDVFQKGHVSSEVQAWLVESEVVLVGVDHAS
jgi:chromosome segregation ATPase